MQLIDVHCHLESEEFADNLDAHIHEARNAGVIKLITAAIHPRQWEQSLTLSQSFPEIECALGIHPWYIRAEYQTDLPALATKSQNRAVAIGEIGLDRKISDIDFDLQLQFFEYQWRIAHEVNLPVVIHCRGAFDDLLRTIKRNGPLPRGGIIHSYSGSAELARQLMTYNLSFSFGGALTYRNSKKKVEVLHTIYPNHFLLETDSPDIPPVEAPEKPNTPSNIVYNLHAAAELLNEPEERVADYSTRNAIQLFNLKV